MENSATTVNKKFSDFVKQKIPQNLSAIDEVASLLNINYDAAYRRMNGTVNFSLEEAVKISEHFDISLNELFYINDPDSYVVRESKPIKSTNDFNTYLEKVYTEMKFLVDRDDASILFSAREIPMFYFFNHPTLVKFKMYIWCFVLNVTPFNKRINYSDFIITDKMVENANRVGQTYQRINVTEIWSFGALNNVLQQLLYFHRLRQISIEDAQQICYALLFELKALEEYTLNNKNNKRKYELYNNDIIMNNNAMIMNFKGTKSFVYPYTLLKFFIINNYKACCEQEEYLIEQLRYCTHITNTSVREHAAFFNHKYDKINQVMQVIKNEYNQPMFL